MKNLVILALCILPACLIAEDDIEKMLRERREALATPTPTPRPTATPQARQERHNAPRQQPTATPRATVTPKRNWKSPGDALQPNDYVRGSFTAGQKIVDNLTSVTDGFPYRLYYDSPQGKGRRFYVVGHARDLRNLPSTLTEVRVISRGMFGYTHIQPLK